MYSIHPEMEPKCTSKDEGIKNNIQLGATGDVRPCNYYGTRLNWQYLEKWCEQKGLDLKKLNLRISSMEEIYESDVWKAILQGHGTRDLPEPCLWHCRKNSPETTGYKETDKGFGLNGN